MSVANVDIKMEKLTGLIKKEEVLKVFPEPAVYIGSNDLKKQIERIPVIEVEEKPMTNFEKYKNEILKYGLTRISCKKGKVIDCYLMNCADCDFYNSETGCNFNKTKWLYEEYKEPPKLTKKERLFCELVETGYIARDKSGSLFFYLRRPYRDDNEWAISDYNYMSFKALQTYLNLKDITFDFIKWEDTKPWAVEDLLKLEVEK